MPSAPPSPAASAGRALKLVAGLLATSLGVGVLAAGVIAPAVAAVGTTANGTVEAFDELPDNLAEQPLSQQSRILYADGSLMATFYYENRVVVPIEKISKNAQDAIVAIEDARFYEHGGVDPEGMGRALVSNLASSSTQGASTLTQQWIKNVLIEQAISELPSSATLEERAAAAADVAATEGTAGYARKLREVKLAIAAEQSLTKPEILDRYLNIANFGDGQYGIETASEHYFNKSAADLTVAEAALLAGIVQQPVAFNPVKNPRG
jgi:membrane peptidoglycan carboxypeptidase